MTYSIKISNSIWSFKESRCSFDTLKDGDANPQNGDKVGIRCHNAITAFFLRIFGKIETVKTSDGKTVYLNKGSLEKWKKWRASQMTSPPKLLSVDNIIEHVANAKARAAKDAKKQAAEKAEAAKNAAKKAARAAKEEKISTCRGEIQSFEDEKLRKEQEISETKEEKEAEETNLTELQGARKEKEEGLDVTLSALEENLRADEANLASIKAEHEAALQGLTEANSALAEKTSSLDEANSSLENVQTIKKDLEQEKSKSEKEKLAKQKQIASKEEKIAKIPFQLTRTDPKKIALKQEVKGLEKEIKDIQSQINTLKEEIRLKTNRARLLKPVQRRYSDEVIRQQLIVETCGKKEAQLKEEVETLSTNNEGFVETIRLKKDQKDTELAEFDEIIQEKQTQIEQLSTTISEMGGSLLELESNLIKANTRLEGLLPPEGAEDSEVDEAKDSEADEPEGSIYGSDDESDVVSDADADPVLPEAPTEELSEAQKAVIAKNQKQVEKALADIAAKVNGDVADIVRALTDKFKDDPSLTAEWVCIDESKGEYALKLSKPIRLWIRPSMDESTETEIIYDTKTPKGVVLLIGDNDRKEFKMRLKKDVIDFLNGFATYCEYIEPTAPGNLKQGVARGPLTKLSYNTSTNIATTHVEAVPDQAKRLLRVIAKRLGAKDEVKVKKTILRDWKNGKVVVEDDYEQFLSQQVALVDGRLPVTSHS